LDDCELERRAGCPESYHVAVLERCVAGDARAVHERAVAAAEVLQDEPIGLAHDRGVPGRYVEVAFGVESDVRKRMAAEADVTFAERFDLSRARAGEKLELRLHGSRVKYQATMARTATAISTMVNVRVVRVSRFGTGGLLPLYMGTGSVLVSVSISGYTYGRRLQAAPHRRSSAARRHRTGR